MNASYRTSITDEEITTAKDILAKLEPGFLPSDIFLEAARLVTLSVVEIVPLRMRQGTIEVLLTRREANDPHFPNMLHTPGTIVRPTDEEGSNASAFHRILNNELASVELSGKPQYVQSVLHKSKRGMENAQIFFVEVIGKPVKGAFYRAEQLPDTIIDSQIGFIHAAVHAFQVQGEAVAKNTHN
jgi:hypothetical protein